MSRKLDPYTIEFCVGVIETTISSSMPRGEMTENQSSRYRQKRALAVKAIGALNDLKNQIERENREAQR